MFNSMLTLITIIAFMHCVELRPYWNTQNTYPGYNYYSYPPQPSTYYPSYMQPGPVSMQWPGSLYGANPQIPYMYYYGMMNPNYRYGLGPGLNNGINAGINNGPTSNLNTNELVSDMESDKNTINFASRPNENIPQQQYYTPNVEIIDEQDLPNFLARIQGRQFPQHGIDRIIPDNSLLTRSKVIEPTQQTEIKQFTIPPHISTNTYVDNTPKKVTVIRNFPGDGSKPKIEILSDLSTRQTPSGLVIINEAKDDTNDDEETVGNDDNEEIEGDDEESVDEPDENAIKPDDDTSEDESHPEPVSNWLFK